MQIEVNQDKIANFNLYTKIISNAIYYINLISTDINKILYYNYFFILYMYFLKELS